MTALVIATRNTHKVGEIRAILGNGYEFKTLADYPGAPKVVEDANTFAGNATKKAIELARWLASEPSARLSGNMFVMADDSGLEVDALNGAPGVHSARFAALDAGHAANSTDKENNTKLLRLLKDVPEEKRTARFRCVIALTPVAKQHPRDPSPVCSADAFEMLTEVFEGACEGKIAVAPSGGGGFGYDPLFVPTGYRESFAELGEEVKNGMSHRARALEKARSWLTRQPS